MVTVTLFPWLTASDGVWYFGERDGLDLSGRVAEYPFRSLLAWHIWFAFRVQTTGVTGVTRVLSIVCLISLTRWTLGEAQVMERLCACDEYPGREKLGDWQKWFIPASH